MIAYCIPIPPMRFLYLSHQMCNFNTSICYPRNTRIEEKYPGFYIGDGFDELVPLPNFRFDSVLVCFDPFYDLKPLLSCQKPRRHRVVGKEKIEKYKDCHSEQCTGDV